MKYFRELFSLNVFNKEDVINIAGSETNASRVIKSFLDKGYIKRIKRDLYAFIDFDSNEIKANKYQIASHINESSFISFHSAFEFYGSYNQVYNLMQISSLKRFASFKNDLVEYSFYSSNTLSQVVVINGTKVTTIERTIIDSINMLGKVMDIEELVKCIELVNLVNEDKLKEMLLEYDKDILYRKTGYILSFFQKELSLSNSFFKFCLKHSNNKNIGMLSNYEINKLSFISKWGIYAYKNLKSLTDKGVYANV